MSLLQKTLTYDRYDMYTSYEGHRSTQTSVGQLSFKDLKLGQVNPSWEALRDMGADAGSPYIRRVGPIKIISPASMILWRFYEYDGDLKLRPASYSIQKYAAMVSMAPFIPGTQPEPDVPSLDAEATIAFLNKAREVISPFQALPFLGELKETIEMVKHPLKGIRKHTRRYSRRARSAFGLKKAGHILDALADSYLQWCYGVTPLLGDIEAMGAAFKKLVSTDPNPIPISVTASLSWQDLLRKPTIDSYYFGAKALCSVVGLYKRRVQIKGAVRSDVAHPLRERAFPTMGFTLEEFVPTLWELLPYSFLIDYVTNVGDILGAKAVATTDLAWYWMSRKQTIRYTGILIPMPWVWPNRPPLSSPGPRPVVSSLEYVSFQRLKPSLKVSLFRDFSFTMPSLDHEIKATVLAFAKLREISSR